MTGEPLLPDEQARLARARAPVDPPADGEGALLAVLCERGLLRPRRHGAALLWALAAAVLIAAVWAVWRVAI